MLDNRQLRNHFDDVLARVKRRGDTFGLEKFPVLDEKRRELIQRTEDLKGRRNEVSKQIPQLKKAGEPADELILEMRQVGDQIKQLDDDLRQVEEELEAILLRVPNLLHESVPNGLSEDDNVEERRWGDVPAFSFEAKPHWDLANDLELLDFERAAKVTGSRFVFYKGAGARLERALINFMIDLHEDQHGYEEVLPPHIVNRDSLQGTGQFPKFEEDVFAVNVEGYYLIPTAEVPVTNLYRDEILPEDALPKSYVAFSTNFRSEAGSAGRDTRGLIRQHQFNKVELIKFVKPEDSYAALEEMTQHAENVLKALKLPYRVITLCAGDTGFSAAKTYDIEVWLPSYNEYKEISSASNTEAFQAQRASIRYRAENGKPEHLHTLNASGLAIGRTVAAVMENYQQADGSIAIPEVLQPYMGNRKKIEKNA
ncbi:serine--tRNA ligase [Aureibacillus halotolerans]|uniref:Serine--tRNA ligase n=1 Tax=Aureibacillus halotolerans TaxID=1508390 RepID=A0A4V6PWG1_9BACI|nr:serine--tRNA ligase [Aureibacillus halotolerans]TDQ38327.1 seryl-tRNA synthetase [Aureibacillus halotolerans]